MYPGEVRDRDRDRSWGCRVFNEVPYVSKWDALISISSSDFRYFVQ